MIVFGSGYGILSVMKEVSIQELKRRLSAFLAEAEAGDTVLVTRHRRPVVRLVPADPEHVHRGKRFGEGNVGPVIHGKTRRRYLEVLLEDRRGGPSPT